MGVEELGRFNLGDAPGFRPTLTFPAENPLWVLGIDQSLSSTGWALLGRDGGGVVRAYKSGMVKTTPGSKTGFEDSLQRGTFIFESLVDEVIPLCGPNLIAHEMPAARPPRSRNREAAPISAMAVRAAAKAMQVDVVMLNAQKVKTVMAGGAKAEKSDVRRGVEQVLGADLGSHLDYYNADVVDAIALALVACSQEA